MSLYERSLKNETGGEDKNHPHHPVCRLQAPPSPEVEAGFSLPSPGHGVKSLLKAKPHLFDTVDGSLGIQWDGEPTLRVGKII